MVFSPSAAAPPSLGNSAFDERVLVGPGVAEVAKPATGRPAPLSGDELAGLAGGDGGVAVAVSNQELKAVNSGNRITADQVVTGSVSLDHNALSNFSGLGNIVVNTGNNNNLQSSLSVSVVMPPH